jgi:hypothetical protein
VIEDQESEERNRRRPCHCERSEAISHAPAGEIATAGYAGLAMTAPAVMTSTVLLFAICFLSCLGVAGAAGREVRDVVGVVHVAGRYHLTDKDFLSEGADQILDLGSRVIKVWFYGKRHERPRNAYPYNSDWPAADSLVGGAQTPYYKALFDKPFTTYVLVVTSLGRDDGYWRNGITAQQIQDEQKQFCELTKHLLTAYKGTGKTFVLQHWEGDWMVRGSFDGKAEPTPQTLANMVAWLNARQAGVNRAREEVGQDGVHVYHAAEVNRVVQSMDSGFPNMVNKVLPHTKLDLISYSAWDSVTARYAEPNVLRSALDFIAAHAPDSTDFGSHNVYLGEFGMPENFYRPEQIQTAVSNAVRVGLDWGCPYIIYWQLYCNELKDPNAKPPVTSNDAVKGFWLIRPDGTKSWVWHYFRRLFETNQPPPLGVSPLRSTRVGAKRKPWSVSRSACPCD